LLRLELGELKVGSLEWEREQAAKESN